MKKICNCDPCKRNRKFKRIVKKIKNIVPNSATTVSYFMSRKIEFVNHKDIKWLEDLYRYLVYVEDELNMIKNMDNYEVHINPADWKGIVGTAEGK